MAVIWASEEQALAQSSKATTGFEPGYAALQTPKGLVFAMFTGDLTLSVALSCARLRQFGTRLGTHLG
jgi:hypothetical protein